MNSTDPSSRTPPPTSTPHFLRFPWPALWFFVLAALLLTLRTLSAGSPGASEGGDEGAVVLTEERVRQLWSERASHLGRELTEEEKSQAIAEAAEDELFFTEAMSRGLHREDPRIRERLLELQAFAQLDTDTGAGSPDADARLESALELELHRRDALVHGWIVEQGRLALLGRQELEDPGDEVLRAFLADRRELFHRPPSVRFQELFFDASQGRSEAEEAAAAVRKELEAGSLTPEEAAGRADPSPLQLGFGPGTGAGSAPGTATVSQLEIQQQLGRPFAEAVFEQEVGRWSPPLPSSQGYHLVLVEEVLEGSELPLEEVRSAVLRGWRRAQRAERKEEVLDELKTKYELRIERPEAGEERS